MLRVCFVCLGNICRSPTAEGILKQLVAEAGLAERIAVESAGTGAYHEGEPPDARSTATARQRGVGLEGAAQAFRAGDFARFDYVFAMDERNLRDLHALAPSDEQRAKIALVRDFEPGSGPGESVPDPYYGEGGFDRVFDICAAACEGVLAHLVSVHDLD